MKDQTDSQLLRAYAECRSEAAFAELVRRHVDIVYSAALRMVCDSHLAEDVSQGVFLALAKSAGQLTDRPVLSGWLHRTTHNIAAQTVRTDVRRRAREQEAAAMHDLLSDQPDASWEDIAPHLDATLHELKEPERDALLLRFFERKSARQMAQLLGTSEDAAQKRVSRAIDRLRELFAKRGITVGASGLVVAISANAVQAAPSALAATISATAATAATAVTAIHTAAAITATKAIAMTTLQKTLIGVSLVAAVGTGIYQARHASALRAQVQMLRNEQAPLTEQLEQRTRERDNMTTQLAAVRAENQRLKQSTPELLKLRGEVGQLRRRTNALDTLQAENRQLRAASASPDPLGALPPEQLVRAVGWGSKSCQEIAARFSADWLKDIKEPGNLLKLGLALYDTGNYSNALVAFRQMEEAQPATALVWQGHLLDLCGKREDAVAAYKKALKYGDPRTRHDQYGIVLSEQYIQERIETPFARVDNQEND